MKLKWKNNEESNLIYVEEPIEMSIHKVLGSGKPEYLFYCSDLGIRYIQLGAKDFEDAKYKVMEVLKHRVNELDKKVEEIIRTNGNVEKCPYCNMDIW